MHNSIEGNDFSQFFFFEMRCVVCLERVGERQASLSCGCCRLHEECATELLQHDQRCPICRETVDGSFLVDGEEHTVEKLPHDAPHEAFDASSFTLEGLLCEAENLLDRCDRFCARFSHHRRLTDGEEAAVALQDYVALFTEAVAAAASTFMLHGSPVTQQTYTDLTTDLQTLDTLSMWAHHGDAGPGHMSDALGGLAVPVIPMEVSEPCSPQDDYDGWDEWD